jgi:hypothetical protein
MAAQLPDPDPGLTDTLPMSRLSVSRPVNAAAIEASLLPESAELSARARQGAIWDASRTLVFRVTNLVITAIVAHIRGHDDGSINGATLKGLVSPWACRLLLFANRARYR